MKGKPGRWLFACGLMVAIAVSTYQPLAKQGGDKVELDVPHMRQETLLCVPTAAAMVLAFYGDAQSPRKLKMLSHGKSYDASAPFTDFSITSYDGLVKGVSTLGYRWTSDTFAMTAEGFEQGLSQIKADLRANRPVLVDISHDGIGHTLVVSGFDDKRRVLFFVDPDEAKPGRETASYEQFEAVWNETAYGGRFRAIIRTHEKRGR